MAYIFEILLLCGGKFIKKGSTKNIIYYNVKFILNYDRSQVMTTIFYYYEEIKKYLYLEVLL